MRQFEKDILDIYLNEYIPINDFGIRAKLEFLKFNEKEYNYTINKNDDQIGLGVIINLLRLHYLGQKEYIKQRTNKIEKLFTEENENG